MNSSWKNAFVRLISSPVRWDRQIVLSSGAFLSLLGLVVIFGWVTHNVAIVRAGTGVAMQFNTALCFVLTGFALIALASEMKKISQLSSFFGAFISFLILCQYFFDINLGIDEFFFKYDLPNFMLHPGRMAFNTSSALFMGNISIFILNHRKNEFFSMIALVFSTLIVSIGVVSFIGHLTGLETEYGWLDFTRMAFHTAVGCLVLGVAVFSFCIEEAIESSLSRIALPASVMIGMISAALSTWQTFRAQEFFALKKLADQQAENLKNAVYEKIEEELLAVRRIVERWQVLGGYSEKLWTIDSANCINDLTGLDALVVFNKDLKMQYQALKNSSINPSAFAASTPEEINNLKIGKTIYTESEHNEFFIFSYPLIVNYEFSGFLTGGIDMSELLKAEIQRLHLGNFFISLKYENRLIFSGGDVNTPVMGAPIVLEIDPKLAPWKIEMFLTENVILPGFISLHLIILIAGISITVLGGILVFIGQNLQIQKKYLEIANIQLQEATKKAEMATTAKSVFLATMSHEIRTPINAIVGTVQLLEKTEVDELQKRYIDRIILSSNNLLSLISEILDFSKIEAGGIKLESVAVNLFDLVKNVADNLMLKAKEKGLDVFLQCPSQPLSEFYTDPNRLQQIISNFGNNSLKFTDKGSLFIKFEVKRKSRDFSFIRFEVTDTGIGIAKEDMPKLFQKFSQVEGSSIRKHGGVGLGLSICKKLVDLMGGDIGVESAVGKGSTFWFEIPMKMRDPKDPEPYSAVGRTIYLSDEKDKERAVLQKYFLDWGAKVVQSPQGCHLAVTTSLEEAGQIHKKEKVKAVLISDSPMSELPEGVSGVLIRQILPSEIYKWVKDL